MPNNDTKKEKITKFSHSHKEINQIYQSIHNWMRQAHKQMNLATAEALTTALDDAILMRAHANSNYKSGLELQNHG